MSATENKLSIINVAATNKFQKSEITVRQFLEFLRTAYQVKHKKNTCAYYFFAVSGSGYC